MVHVSSYMFRTVRMFSLEREIKECGRKIINHGETWRGSSHNGVCCTLVAWDCTACAVVFGQNKRGMLVRRRLFTDNFHSRGGG